MPGPKPGHCRSRGSIRSAQRDGVHQAAAGPEIVETAVELDWAVTADIALKAFAVIADLLDQRIGPFLLEPECLAVARRGADEALDHRIFAFQHLVDILLGDAEFLCLDRKSVV